MASLLMAIIGSILGCEKPSEEIASMISEPQGEGIAGQLRGIQYKAEGPRIRVGNHRLEVFPYVEKCGARGSEHLCGVRFETHVNGKKDERLTYGAVGNADSQNGALQDAVHSWWAGFGAPLIQSLAAQKPDFALSPYWAYPGAMAIRGKPPGGWLDGSAEMHRKLARGLEGFLRQEATAKSIDIRIIIAPDGAKDIGCRVDGRLSREMFQAVSTLPWPKTENEYVFYQAYVLKHKSEDSE